MALLPMVCLVTYLAATPMVSSTPFTPPLNVMPTEPLRKQHHGESLEDHLEMLDAFEEVWATHKRSSQRPSERPGPSLVSSASALAASSSATPASGPSVPAAGARPLTPSESLPSSQSATSSQSSACGQSLSCRPSPAVSTAPAQPPLFPSPSHHWSWSRHQSPGKWYLAARSPS